jgi:hypothetical protein
MKQNFVIAFYKRQIYIYYFIITLFICSCHKITQRPEEIDVFCTLMEDFGLPCDSIKNNFAFAIIDGIPFDLNHTKGTYQKNIKSEAKILEVSTTLLTPHNGAPKKILVIKTNGKFWYYRKKK